MDIIIIMLPLSLILLGIAIRLFFWAVNNNQFEDLDCPAHHIIIDDMREGLIFDKEHTR